MGILKSELCKLLTKRTVLILLLLIVINPLLQMYTIKTPGDDFYTAEEYSELYREIGSRDTGSILAELEKRIDNSASYSEFFLCSRVFSEVRSCIEYGKYLDSIDERADDIAIMHRYVDDGGYAVKNAEKTSEVYRKLKGVTPKVQDPMPVLNVTDNDVTDYLAVIMIFVISLGLVFHEKSEGQLSFLRTTANGRRKLMTAKVAAMFVSVMFVIASLYAVNAIVGRCVFGFVDLSSPIQSIHLYRKSPLDISIGGFLAEYFLAKILSCFLLGTFFMLMGALFGNIVFVFGSSVLVVLVETILRAKIRGTSFLAFLRYTNIMYGVNTREMFSDYVNLNLFGTPVNTCLLYWSLWLIAIVVTAFFVINYLESTHETRADSGKKRSLFRGFESHTSVFRHESFKMLIPGRCLIILALIVAFTIWWNPAAKVQLESIDEAYYKEYMDRFYGPWDEENQRKIAEEQAVFDRARKEMNEDIALGKSGVYIELKYESTTRRQKAFEMVKQHAEYLDSVNGGWMFFDKGYAILTDRETSGNRDVMQAFAYVIMLVALTFGVFGPDYRNSEIRILRSTYHGRRKLRIIKFILGVSCVLITFALVHVVHLANILRAYGTGGINASAASMEHLAEVSASLSMQQYLWIIMLMRLLGGLFLITVVALLFRYLKNNITVIIACVMLFIIPLVLVGLEVPKAEYILLNPLLLGNVF